MRTRPGPGCNGDMTNKRPTVWIVLSCVLAAAVVGLGIWAFSAQSDADDARAELATAQEKASTTETATPAAQETPAATDTPAATETPAATDTPAVAETPAPVEADPELQKQLEQLASDLGATNDSVEQIQKDLDAAAAKVKTAQQERDAAKGALDKAKAEASAVQARVELARTCLSGTVEAVTSAYTSGGADAVKQTLQSIAANCKDVAGS